MAANFGWILMGAVVIASIALGQRSARGADEAGEADDAPGMAAYFQAAPHELTPRVATVVYGDETVGSGVAPPSGNDAADGTRYPTGEGSYATGEGSWRFAGSASDQADGEEWLSDGAYVVARPTAGNRGWLSEMASDLGAEFSGGAGAPFVSSAEVFEGTVCQCGECSGYHWEFLPKDTLYPFYLADTKASRLAGQWIEATDDGTLLDGTLGGRFGVFRYVDATPGPFKRGIQADIEGSAQVRLDMDREHDVRAVDFRAGVPISMSFGRLQTRFGYYHLSSHVGDEFLIRLPAFDRLNYSRDVLFVGGAYWLNESTRVYGEAGWAFYYDVCEPWEFKFGLESAPRRPTGLRGAPFYAVHGRLQEEVDFGGSVTAQLGWAWRSAYNTGLLRTGLHYYNGKSNQFSFYDDHEELIGAGLWYDF